MLEDTEPRGYAIEKTAERCKPDYEKMITTNKEKLRLNTNFQVAIFEYVGDKKLRNKMAELLGELVSEARVLKNSTDRLIEQQANDKG